MILPKNLALIWPATKRWLAAPIAWVLIGGLCIRLYSAAMRTIINPDGAQYIYQASAIFNHDWAAVLACKLAWISPLPILIASAYAVCGDWIVAGHIVNVTFGWATLVPLYFILIRFFDRNVSTLTVLIYALMPLLVEGSGNVIRGPMFWFCICLGMLCFIRQWDQGANAGRYRYDLLSSALLFMLAAWCRIEGVVFLAVPLAYLCLTRTDRKLRRCLFFMLPMAVLGVAACGVVLTTGADLYNTLRLNKVYQEVTQFATNYNNLQAWIRHMYAQSTGIYAEFFSRARESLAFMPLLLIFQNIVEGVFYPFALIFFAGLFGTRRHYLKNRRIAFLGWQSAAGIVVLYIHTLQSWVMTNRFLAIVLFSGSLFMANGMGKALDYLQKRRRWPQRKAMAITAMVLIMLGLPKSLKPEEQDKTVYRLAAQLLAQQGGQAGMATIAGCKNSRGLEWINLYTHRNSPTIICSSSLRISVASDYGRFVADLDRAGIDYLLYEERFWPHEILDLPALFSRHDFRLLGQWQHPDSKKFMLLERIKSSGKK